MVNLSLVVGFNDFCDAVLSLIALFALVACLDGTLNLWPTSSNFVRPSHTVYDAHVKGTETGSVVFSVDGRTVLSRGNDDFAKRASVSTWSLYLTRPPLIRCVSQSGMCDPSKSLSSHRQRSRPSTLKRMLPLARTRNSSSPARQLPKPKVELGGVASSSCDETASISKSRLTLKSTRRSSKSYGTRKSIR